MPDLATVVPLGDARCPQCLEPLPAAARAGRPRKWCSDKCRRAAGRRRDQETLASWSAAGDQLQRLPTDAATQQRRTVAALVRALDNEPPAPAEDQLAQSLIELRQLIFTLRRAAPDLQPALRTRAQHLVAAIEIALVDQFGDAIT